MRKFIVFCLILIVTVSLGVTVFYFMRDNEELVVNADPYIYENKGKVIHIDAELKNAKVGNEIIMTSLTPSVLEYNPALNGFEAIEGGAGVIEIKTKNSKIPAIHIQVSVGNGMKQAPFFITGEEDLENIGKDGVFELSHHYILQQDISISSNFTPIGTGSNTGFTGSLNGNGYAIKNLTISSADGVVDAGLFAKIGATGVVTNVSMQNVNISGQFNNAGAIAGVNLGTINRSEVVGGSVTSTLANSNVGGIAGAVEFSNSNVGRIDRSFASLSVAGTLNVGGLAGINNGGILINSYVLLDDEETITALSNGACAGGIVGTNAYFNNKVASIKNCYAKGTVLAAQGLDNSSIKLASIVGFNDESSDVESNNLMGLYTEGSTLATANHEFVRTFSETEKAQEKNFRGLYSSFPKDSNDNILASEMISYVPRYADNNKAYETWDFTNVWVLSDTINGGYPSLNKLGADVPDNIALAYNPSTIKTAEDLIQMAVDINSGNGQSYYRLENDITLTGDFTPIGTNSSPFNGVFDGNNKTISGLSVSSTVIDNMGEAKNKLAGLFGKISSNASIKNLNLNGVSIASGATYAGGLVGFNEGVIQNVTITQDALNAEVNNISGVYAVGGVAGISLGVIENCKVVNQTVNVSALDNVQSRYAGGIAGINGQENSGSTATIRNSSVVTSYVYDSETDTAYPEDFKFRKNSRDFIKVLSSATFYVGGIAGANYYEITQNYTYNSNIKIDEYSTHGVVAGVVGMSKASTLLSQGEAEVSYNKVLGGTIKGFAAAGLVSHLYGIAKFNHVEAQTIYGLMVAGLTNDIKVNGRLNNCFVKSHLSNFSSGNYANGSAGITNYARFQNKDYYGEFTTIFSACTFESTNYVNHYDSNADYRVESNVVWDTRTDGYGNYLIWVTTGHATVLNGAWFGDSKQNNLFGISEEQAKLMVDEEYVVELFTTNGFSTEDWSFDAMSYPSIKNLPEIEEAV